MNPTVGVVLAVTHSVWGKFVLVGTGATATYLAVELSNLNSIPGYAGGVTAILVAWKALSAALKESNDTYRQIASIARHERDQERKRFAELLEAERAHHAVLIAEERERHRQEVELLRSIMMPGKRGAGGGGD